LPANKWQSANGTRCGAEGFQRARSRDDGGAGSEHLDTGFALNIFSPRNALLTFEKSKDPTRPSGETTMLDENLARIRAHRNNIHRYRRLLKTRLSELERDFIERRLEEEQSAFDELAAASFPVGLPLSGVPADTMAVGR
jgi:hypothetical protein